MLYTCNLYNDCANNKIAAATKHLINSSNLHCSTPLSCYVSKFPFLFANKRCALPFPQYLFKWRSAKHGLKLPFPPSQATLLQNTVLDCVSGLERFVCLDQLFQQLINVCHMNIQVVEKYAYFHEIIHNCYRIALICMLVKQFLNYLIAKHIKNALVPFFNRIIDPSTTLKQSISRRTNECMKDITNLLRKNKMLVGTFLPFHLYSFCNVQKHFAVHILNVQFKMITPLFSLMKQF